MEEIDRYQLKLKIIAQWEALIRDIELYRKISLKYGGTIGYKIGAINNRLIEYLKMFKS